MIPTSAVQGSPVRRRSEHNSGLAPASAVVMAGLPGQSQPPTAPRIGCLQPDERAHEYLAGGRIRACWRTDCDHVRRAAADRRTLPTMAMDWNGAA